MATLHNHLRVLVVSDVRLFRQGLKNLLRDQSGLKAVMTASRQDEVLHHLRVSDLSVVLLDLAMTDSVSIMKVISAVQPSLPVTALAVPDNTADVIACAEAGFAGYIHRDATVDDLVAGLRGAITGELLCSARVAGGLYRQISKLRHCSNVEPISSLTKRESEIAGLIEKGFSNKEIAKYLRISPSTVKNHVHHILDKLGVHRRGEAVAELRNRVSRPYRHEDLDS